MKRRHYFFANAVAVEQTEQGFLFANAFASSTEGWVQLSPFGDFWNTDAGGNKAIQRLTPKEAQEICNSFDSVARKVLQPLGAPWYVGHPDHPKFKAKAGNFDQGAKGRIKEMQVRHDAACTACAQFANSGVPCGTHGLFARVKWNSEGEQMIANEVWSGHSVNWAALPGEMENGVRVWHPTRIKSVGFTNEPNIPVQPATLANSGEPNEEPENMIIPPWLKVLAGFKADEGVTEEQIKTALDKALTEHKANEHSDEAEDLAAFNKWLAEILGLPEGATRDEMKAKLQQHANDSAVVQQAKKRQGELESAEKKHYEAQTKLRQHLANAVADNAYRRGQVTEANKGAVSKRIIDASEEELANILVEVEKMPQAVKTAAKTSGLGGQNVELMANVQDRQGAWERLMKDREQQFPNESYDARWNAVAATAEGKQLMAQMTQPTKA